MASQPNPISSDLRRQLAQLADQRTAPADKEGYVAERHPLLPTLVLVWAPCGCVWVGNNEDNFVTPCGLETCHFRWVEALGALQALHAAEKQASTAPTAPSALATSIAATEPPAPVGADILQPEQTSTEPAEGPHD